MGFILHSVALKYHTVFYTSICVEIFENNSLLYCGKVEHILSLQLKSGLTFGCTQLYSTVLLFLLFVALSATALVLCLSRQSALVDCTTPVFVLAWQFAAKSGFPLSLGVVCHPVHY